MRYAVSQALNKSVFYTYVFNLKSTTFCNIMDHKVIWNGRNRFKNMKTKNVKWCIYLLNYLFIYYLIYHFKYWHIMSNIANSALISNTTY